MSVSRLLFRRVGCVEFEKDNVAILHDVVPPLLPVFPSSLRGKRNKMKRGHKLIFNDVSGRVNIETGRNSSLFGCMQTQTLAALSLPSSLKSVYFITSAMMKPFSKSVWIFPAA